MENGANRLGQLRNRTQARPVVCQGDHDVPRHCVEVISSPSGQHTKPYYLWCVLLVKVFR